MLLSEDTRWDDRLACEFTQEILRNIEKAVDHLGHDRGTTLCASAVDTRS